MKNKSELQTIAKEFNLKFVVLFGSRARGQQKNKESDLDIAIYAEKNPNSELFFQLFNKLSQIFPKENIDIRFLNDADMLFRFNVVKDGELLYGDETEYKIYKLATIKMYTDDLKKFSPFFDRLLQLNQERLESNL